MSREKETMLKLLRSNGVQEEISFPLTNSLKDLKLAIAQSNILGKIPISKQRIFHLGRELKTAGRSLETLGVGRLGAMVIHVHASGNQESTAKPCASSGTTKKREIVSLVQSTATDVVDLAGSDDDDDDDCVIVDEVATANSKRRKV